MALRFCGRHAGDQGRERTDWAGLEPPGSLGAPLFNHSAAKQSDGELHMPLVSPRFFLPPSSSLSFCFPHIFSPLAVLPMLLLISQSSLLISDRSPRACLGTAARGESVTAPARTSWWKSESFQKDLIVSGTIAEAPDAIYHKSNVRSRYYNAANHMVSGVFRLYCPVEMRVGDTARRLL